MIKNRSIEKKFMNKSRCRTNSIQCLVIKISDWTGYQFVFRIRFHYLWNSQIFCEKKNIRMLLWNCDNVVFFIHHQIWPPRRSRAIYDQGGNFEFNDSIFHRYSDVFIIPAISHGNANGKTEKSSNGHSVKQMEIIENLAWKNYVVCLQIRYFFTTFLSTQI